MDPQLSPLEAESIDDVFGEDVKPEIERDIKPKVEQTQLKVEIPDARPNAVEDEEMEDLFGDDDAEGMQKERTTSPSASASVHREGSEALSASELRHRRELEYEEGEGDEENVVELKHAVLSIPNIPMPRSSDHNNWVIRIPNFVKLDPKPFDPETYVGPEHADGILGEREKSMSIKLEVENTIRWRWGKDQVGNDIRQSNSRIVRWSDGSLSLLLGKELFDVNQAYEGASALPRQTPSGSNVISLSQSQGPPTSQQTARPQATGLTYLVAQHKRPGILQAEAPITGHMTLRPTGMQSETHRMLARAVGQKHSKVARLRMAPDPTVDPAKEQQELMKAAARKPRRSRGAAAGDDDGLGGSQSRRRRGAYGKRRGESVWSDEEPEPGTFGDTDEEDDDGYGARGSGSRKKRRSSGGEAEADGDRKRGAGEYQTDDFLVADSSEGEASEGDSDEGGRRKDKKKKRRPADDDDDNGDVDDLDAMDAKIARQEEESRRKKRHDHSGVASSSARAASDEVGAREESAEAREAKEGEDAAMDVDMDVESEEEEEDFNARRTGKGSRKKRAIAMDDEEEE